VGAGVEWGATRAARHAQNRVRLVEERRRPHPRPGEHRQKHVAAGIAHTLFLTFCFPVFFPRFFEPSILPDRPNFLGKITFFQAISEKFNLLENSPKRMPSKFSKYLKMALILLKLRIILTFLDTKKSNQSHNYLSFFLTYLFADLPT